MRNAQIDRTEDTSIEGQPLSRLLLFHFFHSCHIEFIQDVCTRKLTLFSPETKHEIKERKNKFEKELFSCNRIAFIPLFLCTRTSNSIFECRSVSVLAVDRSY